MKNKSLWVLLIVVFIFFIGYKYINSHLEIFYGLKADYYFKNNNIEQAQKFYEKAFELGLKDSNKREKYINSIINSPLTIESQEKLIKFIEHDIDDVANLKAKFFIRDIKQEILRKYDENFINNAIFNKKIIRWGNNPISYSFVNKNEAPEYFIAEINKAFNEWEKALSQELFFMESDENPNIIIKFEDTSFSNSNSEKFVVAYTTPYLNFNELKNMEILFYLKNPYKKYFTKNQVYNTALHEIAHALGFMGHSDNKDDVLYLSKNSKLELKDSRLNLSEADINTIRLLYKIKPEITNIKNPKSEYLPKFVLGSAKEVHNEKISEAELYIKKAPHLPAGYLDLAEAYVNIKDYQKAIKYLKIALRKADTDEIQSIVYFNLAVVNYYMDECEKALYYLEKTRQIKDSDEKIYLLAEIYTKESKMKQAQKIYSDLLYKNPQNIEYAIALTNTYVLEKNYIKARNVLKTFFTNNPNERTNQRFNSYGILKFGL